ncbi:MAG TPA: phage holin family protein [Polyangiaceae bacterium]|nr:phage holin family protein [Polyangiaceae bacterium]
MAAPDIQRPEDGESTGELLRKALEDVQNLARAEVALAGKELGSEARDVALVSLVLAVSIAASVCAVALAVGALIVGLGGTLTAALGVAAAILAVTGAGGIAVSLSKAPKTLLPRTRDRVSRNLTEMKDHFA